MTNLIDVHILHLPDENQEWWDLCKKSLKGHPIIGYQWRTHGEGYHRKLNKDLRKEIHEMIYERIKQY